MRRWEDVVAALLKAALLVGCRREKPVLPVLDISDISVQKAAAALQPFGVDICVDATPSMDGFAADPGSAYRRFLEDIEGFVRIGSLAIDFRARASTLAENPIVTGE